MISKSCKARGAAKVTAALKHAARHATQILDSSMPRRIDAFDKSPPVIIFTDGAAGGCPAKFTCGGVIFDRMRKKPLVFGRELPSTLTDRAQIICQVEMCPVVWVKATLGESLRGRKVIWFIDNESALWITSTC